MNPSAAEEDVIARAHARVREHPSMSFADAIDEVIQDAPELYSESLLGRAAQRRPPPPANVALATPREPRAFAERQALDAARDRAVADGTSFARALDAVLEEQPELFREANGEAVEPLTQAQHDELRRYRETY